MGNHLSVRPEPGVPDAASSDSPSIWSCCGRGLPCGAALADAPGGLLPHPFTLTRIAPGGILSVALAFLRRIVRSILLFKRTPRSMQSGLSSTGTEMNPLRPRLPATGLNIAISGEYTRAFRDFFSRSLPFGSGRRFLRRIALPGSSGGLQFRASRIIFSELCHNKRTIPPPAGLPPGGSGGRSASSPRRRWRCGLCCSSAGSPRRCAISIWFRGWTCSRCCGTARGIPERSGRFFPFTGF